MPLATTYAAVLRRGRCSRSVGRLRRTVRHARCGQDTPLAARGPAEGVFKISVSELRERQHASSLAPTN